MCDPPPLVRSTWRLPLTGDERDQPTGRLPRRDDDQLTEHLPPSDGDKPMSTRRLLPSDDDQLTGHLPPRGNDELTFNLPPSDDNKPMSTQSLLPSDDDQLIGQPPRGKHQLTWNLPPSDDNKPISTQSLLLSDDEQLIGHLPPSNDEKSVLQLLLPSDNDKLTDNLSPPGDDQLTWHLQQSNDDKPMSTLRVVTSNDDQLTGHLPPSDDDKITSTRHLLPPDSDQLTGHLPPRRLLPSTPSPQHVTTATCRNPPAPFEERSSPHLTRYKASHLNNSEFNTVNVSFRLSEDHSSVFAEGMREVFDVQRLMERQFCTEIPLPEGKRINFINSKLKPYGMLVVAMHIEKNEGPNESARPKISDVQICESVVDRKTSSGFKQGILKKQELLEENVTYNQPVGEDETPSIRMTAYVLKQLQRFRRKNRVVIKAGSVMKLNVIPEGVYIDPEILDVIVYEGVEIIQKRLSQLLLTLEDKPKTLEVINHINCVLPGIPNVKVIEQKTLITEEEDDGLQMWAALVEVTKQVEEEERDKKKKKTLLDAILMALKLKKEKKKGNKTKSVFCF